MAVSTTHPDYTASVGKWKRCRDVIAGGDAVHSAGAVYLSDTMFRTDIGVDLKDYQAYQQRAGFFGATQRTLDGLTGMVFRKDPEVAVPAAIEPYLDDITLSGVGFKTFCEQYVDQLIQVGRVGVLVDYPRIERVPVNKAEQLAQGLRPYVAMYPAESVINWKTTSVNNKQALSLVVLKEQVSESGGDEFEHSTTTRYRVLDLDQDGFYRVRIFNDKNEILGEFYPLVGGVKANYLPFVMAGVMGEGAEVAKPPLLDLVDANLEHYRLMADYRHGLHFTALPTPVITGHQLQTDDQGNITESLRIGATTAWVFQDPQANAFYLEFAGSGLGMLESAISKLEANMALLGARIIAADKRAAESAQTADIHRAGEASVLSSIANSASRCLSRILDIVAIWDGIQEDCTVKLNTDFVASSLTPQELSALLSAYQGGAISAQTLFYNLQYGEVIEQGVTFEEEQARIDTANIPAPQQGAANAQTNP